MKILAVGGGSGGHVTPVVAVLAEIKKKLPTVEIRFWCDKKFAPQARKIMGNFDENIPVHTIFAGKFRRYHHLSVWQQITWPSLILANIRDSFLAGIGLLQSIIKLMSWRPDVIFTKGGFVCLPVGIAAHLLGIPLVVHDSDAHPGLTNRILSRWATAIATGAPLKYYNYPHEISQYVGIPISNDFHMFSDSERMCARKQWGISQSRPLVVVTGGGLGASRINDAVVSTLSELLKLASVVLISGVGQYDELHAITPVNNNHFQLHSFVSKDMAKLLGAADLVVTRAGATTLLELAALAKPTILIPNAKLTGGHQLKNAAVYQDEGAVVVLNEEQMIANPQLLVSAVNDLLTDSKRSKEMTRKFATFACPDAARDVAKMIISSVK
jgi:UDP-N-acetylglucosamine--N-acetylmuramyl-(pentapeptide) pyrophosphoryl-undecaprenol N-acetylglucosamine transferase